MNSKVFPENNSRLLLTITSGGRKQEKTLTTEAIQIYSNLLYQLHKEDELEKTFYEESLDFDQEDDLDNEEDNNADSNYEEDYEFDYHRYK